MNPAEKLEQLEASGLNISDLHNQTRDRLMKALSAQASLLGIGDGTPEGVFRAMFKGTATGAMFEEGLLRQKEINSELVPWLKAKGIQHTDPTTRGIIFVVNKVGARLSIAKQTQEVYDIEIYPRLSSPGPVTDAARGYTPSKKMGIDSLKCEILGLMEYRGS